MLRRHTLHGDFGGTMHTHKHSHKPTQKHTQTDTQTKLPSRGFLVCKKQHTRIICFSFVLCCVSNARAAQLSVLFANGCCCCFCTVDYLPLSLSVALHREEAAAAAGSPARRRYFMCTYINACRVFFGEGVLCLVFILHACVAAAAGLAENETNVQ